MRGCVPWCWRRRGKSFSAGADLKWMRATAGYAEAENLADARALAELMRTLNGFPKPTLASGAGAGLRWRRRLSGLLRHRLGGGDRQLHAQRGALGVCCLP